MLFKLAHAGAECVDPYSTSLQNSGPKTRCVLGSLAHDYSCVWISSGISYISNTLK